MPKTINTWGLASAILLEIDIDELTEKTKEIINLPRQEAEKRYETMFLVITQKNTQIEFLTKDLLEERAFFKKIGANYNNITGYDVDCIKVAIAEYLLRKANKT